MKEITISLFHKLQQQVCYVADLPTVFNVKLPRKQIAETDLMSGTTNC